MRFDYERFNEHFFDLPLTFFNYGFVPPEGPGTDWILEEDLPDRHCLNMVRKVLGGADVEGARVLEVGCGRGGNCSYLARYAKAGAVLGLDRCPSAIAYCSGRHRGRELSFLIGEAEALPLRGGAFDLVLNLESAHGYDHFGRFLSEVRRVLRPGGLFCLADVWDMPGLPMDWTAREKELKGCGLEVLLETDISRGVVEAIEADDNLAARVAAMTRGSGHALVDGIVKGSEILRNTLTFRECRYMSWVLRK